MTNLSEFQNNFGTVLLASPAATATLNLRAITSQPGFAVYRNTVMKGCVDALQANYPAVARLTGDAWFRKAAVVYARETLPSEASLLQYGATFAAFLDNFEPAADWPYLAGIARLDRMWIEAHCACDEPPLDPAALARLAPEVIGSAMLYPHAAARWAWFVGAPVFSIWSSMRRADFARDEILPSLSKAEGALLTRTHDTVEWFTLDAAGFAFIDTCAAGSTIVQAASAAITADPDVDLEQMMALLLQAGAFSRMRHPHEAGQT